MGDVVSWRWRSPGQSSDTRVVFLSTIISICEHWKWNLLARYSLTAPQRPFTALRIKELMIGGICSNVGKECGLNVGNGNRDACRNASCQHGASSSRMI